MEKAAKQRLHGLLERVLNAPADDWARIWITVTPKTVEVNMRLGEVEFKEQRPHGTESDLMERAAAATEPIKEKEDA